jgi:asparagine synthase (glutamine-hydrolysing)
MCGIAGVLSRSGNNQAAVRAMVGSLDHRGPDASSFWMSGHYFAGMRRLSINDLDGGGQPLFDSSRRVVLFYNGEIYNSPQLRAELMADGFVFKTHSDGEVICHLYRKHGKDFLAKLDGMFAIALWDDEKQLLLLARDFPGEKPLYYSRLADGGIAFASEIPSLVKCSSISKDLNYQGIWDFPTFLWIPEPQTIYKNIQAILPGECIEISLKNEQKSTFFKNQLPRVTLDSNISLSDVVDIVRDVVTKSIKSRLLSDVPIGAFLSGGLDSSIICAVARKELSELNTFCIGFDQLTDPYHGYADESRYAEEFAKKINANHKKIRVSSSDFRKLLPKFLKAAGQPYAVSSGLGILAISDVAKKSGIKVLLSGDGADEAFGGYSWYAHIPEIFSAQSVKSSLNRFVDCKDSDEEKAKRMAAYSPAEQAWAWHYYASEKEKSEMFTSDVISSSSLRYFEQSTYNQPIDFLRHDRAFYFPNEMLSKVDRMTMAFSVEGRAPFAAPNIQLLAEQIPWEILVRDGQLKWVLRQAFSDVLSKEVLDRKKHGFNVPIDNWLKNDWSDLFEETFSKDSHLSRNNLLRKDARSNALKILNNPNKITGHVIFSYVMLNMWMAENE